MPTLKLGAGWNDFNSSDDDNANFKAELHSDFQLLNDIGPLTSIHPFVGFETTSDGGYYAYAGPAADFALSPSWVVTPSLAVGYYEQGGAKDLGNSHLEFRSGAELAYRMNNGQKVGVEYTNTSAWGTHDGGDLNSLTLNYHIPFGVAGMF